jgi:hypothetical protein
MSYETVLPLLVSDHYSYVPKHMDCLHKHLYQFHSHHLKIEIKKTVSVHVYYTLFILKDEYKRNEFWILCIEEVNLSWANVMSEKLHNRNIAKTRQPYNNHQYPIYYWHIAKFQKCWKYCSWQYMPQV